jgi:hypothetical protein
MNPESKTAAKKPAAVDPDPKAFMDDRFDLMEK